MNGTDFSNMSMVELFRIDAETQLTALTSGLLVLERDPISPDQLESCMRAAHSLKGAARIVNLNAAVRVAHAMEECLVAAQTGRFLLGQDDIDVLLRGVDVLRQISQTSENEISRWDKEAKDEIDILLEALDATLHRKQTLNKPPEPIETLPAESELGQPAAKPASPSESADRVLRVTADNLNRLLGLAGESLVESRWPSEFSASLLRLKRMHSEVSTALEGFREMLPQNGNGGQLENALSDLRRQFADCEQFLGERLKDVEIFDHRTLDRAHRLYQEALACRMRPFGDCIQGFPRMIRDVARSLGKEAHLIIEGSATPGDRDILEKLEAPLGHLLQNALDHGIETPSQRTAAGKPSEGTLRLEARHNAGRLEVLVEDDGKGIDLVKLRKRIVTKELADAATVDRMSEQELLEFIFLPGFSMKDEVTEISGRGVGLDIVRTLTKQVRGTTTIWTQPGRGTRVLLQLPLTLSVLRTLLVEIAGEPYAFPLFKINRTLKLRREQVESLEGRQHFRFENRQIGLVTAHQILGLDLAPGSEEICVVVIGNDHESYGIIVDKFLGERELIAQTLDPRLGKIKDIAAGALSKDGAPALILDVEDLLVSVEKLVSTGHLQKIGEGRNVQQATKRRRVLIVDDSLTVRELERKLLSSQGYEVAVAVDGMDGWNAVRGGHFDLVVTDVDMPRMDGIELVTSIKKDPRLNPTPVMIVSYKDREEDRRRGLEAGADYYLTKGSFHDDRLLQAVVDLIGKAEA